MWHGVDLERELSKIAKRDQAYQADEVLNKFKKLLEQDAALDDQILRNIFSNTGQNSLKIRNIDPDKIYCESQIKRLCVEYRLRFLDACYFKGEIPYEAISKIKRLQRSGGRELTDFKILAPAPMFNLAERDKDPLLFLPLGSGHHYMVHKWGGDLHPLRRLLVFPFRNFKTLLATVAALAFTVVMTIPDSVYMGPYDQSSAALRVIFFFYLFIAFCGLTALYGFSRVKNFNGSLWNSRFID